MDRIEGLVVGTISVCVATVLSIAILAGAQCQKEVKTKQYEFHKAAVETGSCTVVIDGSGP